MKNVTSLKSNNNNSPKTPGGISKNLLTPCRRLGLSRNWRKSGPSPFISPLSSNSADVKEEREARKRKERVPSENIEGTTDAASIDENVLDTDSIDQTPTRNVEIPRRKKSKTLISAINKSEENMRSLLEITKENCTTEQSVGSETVEVVTTPVRSNSKKTKKRTPMKTTPKIFEVDHIHNTVECNEDTPFVEQKKDVPVYSIKEKSPNDLRKECIVVIQRKIFKNVENKAINDVTARDNKKSHDSDSDEAPLINLHKQDSTKTKAITNIVHVYEDDDFIDDQSSTVKTGKSKVTKSPRTKNKTVKLIKTKVGKSVEEQNCASLNNFDDEDDDFDNKKTILIRKSYEKPSKPVKAKSTGSITQRDIDKLRERIEAKKKLLMAQSLTPDTEELRNLIKKWQKGCQEALMELLDLMRNKFSDNERMDYSAMLKTLKIPPSLVGYDSENDCFNSPDDASIILGQFNDL